MKYWQTIESKWTNLRQKSWWYQKKERNARTSGQKTDKIGHWSQLVWRKRKIIYWVEQKNRRDKMCHIMCREFVNKVEITE